MRLHEMHGPYGRRYPNVDWRIDLYLTPEWALPHLREEPHGRPVEKCMIHAPLVEEEDKVLVFGSLAK